MFTIVISEKGGAERRETFDRTEISVGRVQGNDLMLPKGNVSKHHARLTFRDARFVVTDLKSTNGTYVNGRKIAQATIVREGDKIYVGDFVLRVEAAQAVAPAVPGDGARDGARDVSRESPRAPELSRSEITGSGHRPSYSSSQDVTAPAPGSPQVPPPGPPAMSTSNPPSPAIPNPPGAVSHYPLERDPDSESAPEIRGAVVPRVPGPPRLPQAAEVRPRALAPPLPDRASAPPSRMKPIPSLPSVRPVDRSAPRETPQQAARRLALITLVDRVCDVVDASSLPVGRPTEADVERIDRAVVQQASAMREEGESPAGVDVDRLTRDAVRELLGIGPLGAYLEDEEVTEIHVARADSVLVTRGAQIAPTEPCFTSDEALARIVARLADQAGQPMRAGEALVERRLPSGARFVAIGPPASSAWALAIRKRQRFEASLDDLVRAGSLSRPMAMFLETCVGARANVLVTGSGTGAVATVLSALAGAPGVGDRIVVLQEEDEIAVLHAQATSLELAGDLGAERWVKAAAQLGRDRLVVASLTGSVAAATLDAIAAGSEGVLAGLEGPSLRQGLARLGAQIAARTGTSSDAAREGLAESFDIAVDARRGPDGKLRILRIAELAGTDAKGVAARDIFAVNPDATGDAAFTVTGTIPRFAHELAARGVRLDPGIFRRVSRGN
ncbi:MAG TPA: ATPase, T2SS/T4P/T4SS family [Polyangiaceae bacterium]|jgi:pilus assembly protein CpaF|nr:ATPase, T2SS/T4P/T4SS family [Polyangiaceae bacterium]